MMDRYCAATALPTVIMYIYILLCCYTVLTGGDALSSTEILRDNKFCVTRHHDPESIKYNYQTFHVQSDLTRFIALAI